MTETDRLLKAKIPCPETGIEIKKSLCDICAPGSHCGLDVYVKDGEVLKVEGTVGYPGSNGKLCTRGAANREYLYRPDRIRTPLRRVGPRGSGEFERISWEEAYQEIAENLNAIKQKDGPEAVMWYTGYSKWYRPWLHRLTHSFGSLNYGTESSSCYRATEMAWRTVAGMDYAPDLMNSNVFLGWACNSYINAYQLARRMELFKEKGGKIIIVDPRDTPTARRLADIHLRPHPGTDGALALGMCRIVFHEGWTDDEFLREHALGLEEFKALTEEYTLERTEAITGVPKEDVYAATKLYATNGPASAYSASAAITHHTNGYNNFRALASLQAICGNLDRKGGMLPIHFSYNYTDCGYRTAEDEFVEATRPAQCRERVGSRRFPVWNAFMNEAQAIDMARQFREKTPYPLKALMAFGMNNRMFPQPGKMLEAFEELEFVAAVDLIMTDTCRHADIVLPACTSLERSELKCYPGGLITCTEPVIPPLYESRPDHQIICELAQALDLDDALLKQGADATMRFMIKDLPVTLEELRAAELPIRMPEEAMDRYQPGTYRKNGFPTPSGKVELCSTIIEEINKTDPRFDPLPSYRSSFDGEADPERPFTMIVGARLPNAIHSRIHTLSWTRSLRKDPAVDMNPGDAARLGIKDGDDLRLTTAGGSITVKAHLTYSSLPGDLYFYHGYREADGNSLIPDTHLDPYSGFPGFRQVRCKLERIGD